MIRAAVILALVILAGCSHQLAACRGPVTPLNVGQWQPTAEDLRP